MEARFKLPIATIAAVVLAIAPTRAQGTDGTEAKPPSVEAFEEPVVTPTGADNGAAFRFTYPVRDGQNGQVFTEQRSVPADVPSAMSEEEMVAGEALPPEPLAPIPQGMGTGQPAPFETVGEAGAGQSADIGEGIFERRPFRYSFSLYEGYNSNVNTRPNGGVQSMYTEVAAGVAYEFGSSRLNLETSLAAALTFYYNNKGLQNNGLYPTVNFIVGADYEATPRLDLSFNTLTQVLSQPNFTVAGAPNTDQGEYLLSDSTLGAKYLWMPKLATETTYNPLIFYYFDPAGNTTDFSRVEQTIGQQFLFLWKPQTALVAEYRFNTRNYFYAKNYDSLGNYALLGFDHSINPRSTATFRGGVEQRNMQNPDNVGSNSYFGPFGQLNLNYSPNPDTTFSLQSRYGTTASGITSYNQGQQLLLGVNAAHQFTKRIAANIFFNYQNNFYNQPDSVVNGVNVAPDFSDNVFNTGLNASFQINRVWSLLAGYTFSALDSTNPNQQSDYNQSIVFLGLEVDL